MEFELLPNPDGCKAFERHQFKKERCKNCGKRWQEHRGVISESLLQEFILKEAKAEEERRQRQQEAEAAKAEALAKVKARAKAKKKRQLAPEDTWLFGDDGNEGGESEEDTMTDFRMMAGSEVMPEMRPSAPVALKQPKVVNLIDFKECDVAAEVVFKECDVAAEVVDAVATADTSADMSADVSADVTDDSSSKDQAPLSWINDFSDEVADEFAGMGEEALLAEIDHLRQRLKDADAEKAVQVSIVRDEVDEKQRIIEDLEQKKADAEKSLHEAQMQMEILRQERDAAALAAEGQSEAKAVRDSEDLREPKEGQDDARRAEEKFKLSVMEEDLRCEQSERTGLMWKLLEQRYWLKCLRPSDLSDAE